MSEFVVQDIPDLGPVAIPTTTAELGRFLALQRAINALVRKHRILDSHTISEDGRLGPGTRKMYNLIAGFIPELRPASSITSMAIAAEDWARIIAKEAGVPYDASVPPGRMLTTSTSKPKVTTASVGPLPEPKKKAVWWILGLLAVGAAVVGVVTYTRRRRG